MDRVRLAGQGFYVNGEDPGGGAAVLVWVPPQAASRPAG